MSLTAFTSRLGTGQGRLVDGGVTSNTYAFVLGDQDLGHYAELTPGDYVQITQSTDLTEIPLIRAAVELRIPSSTPTAYAWNAVILVDGTRVASTTARSGRSRVITDLAANVSKLSGPHDVALRLELVAT